MSVEKDESVTPREVRSLKKLAGTNFGKFALQVQHVSTEVQMKIIEQLPEFRNLATDAIDKISAAQESTLKSFEHSEDHVHQGASEWRAALIAMLDDPNLTLDEKLSITAQIGETVRTQKAVHSEGIRAKAALFGAGAIAVVAVVGAIVVAVAGGKIGIDGGSNDA